MFMREPSSQVSWGRSVINSIFGGDTVNTAARMMAMGSPGSVAMVEEVWNEVSADFEGDPLGELEVKGKGRVSVYGVRKSKS